MQKDGLNIKDFTQIFTIRGESISITAPAKFNESTGEMVYDQKLDDDAIELAQNIYREKHAYIMPHEIKIFRETLGMSQSNLAILLGCSQETIVMYESGAIPTIRNNLKMKILFSQNRF